MAYCAEHLNALEKNEEDDDDDDNGKHFEQKEKNTVNTLDSEACAAFIKSMRDLKEGEGEKFLRFVLVTCVT